MWHEARRQERKIRGMLVDYRRRAERRRDFYEKIKADPTQFLQIHGRQCKIHLDANIAAAADNAVMMPWQGHTDNLIDRFDVRAHLDYIPPIEKPEEEKLTQDERHLNYERYRIIAQNSFLGVPEEKFLKQLHLEEQFGYTEFKSKKDSRLGGAAIGFNYEDSTGVPQELPAEDTSDEENSDSDLDVDLAINVSKMDPAQANEMNKYGRSYGMSSNDFYSFLINDLEEAEAVKQAREEEQEKALFSGRKSRRERRYHREKRLANRTISPPSYAAKASPTLPNLRESKSISRTPSPENSGKITYITSFGEDEETPSSSKTPVNRLKYGKSKSRSNCEKPPTVSTNKRRSRSKDKYYKKSIHSKNIRKSRRSRTRSKSRSRRSRSNSRSGYRRHKSRSSSSRSRSYSRSCSRSRRSSRSKDRSRSFRRRLSTSSSSSSSKSNLRSSSSDSSRRRSPKKKTPEKNKTNSIPNHQETSTDVIPRYYGRRKNDDSSSELSDLNEDDKTSFNSNGGGDSQKDSKSTAPQKPSSSLTVIERLKRKRQALLNRQFKADKIAELAKTERERLEQQTREDELREMAIKLRKRQREKRHANDSVTSSDSEDSSQTYDSNYSKERSRSRSKEKESRRHRRRSRRSSEERRSTSRERRRRERKERSRRSPSPNRSSKDRYKEDRDKVKLVNY